MNAKTFFVKVCLYLGFDCQVQFKIDPPEIGLNYLLNKHNKLFAKNLPKWFRQNFPESIYTQQHLFDEEEGIEKIREGQITLYASVPERAILEVLSLVPHAFDYLHAMNLVENLQLLRPNLLQKLLEDCRVVKVKRLLYQFLNTKTKKIFEE